MESNLEQIGVVRHMKGRPVYLKIHGAQEGTVSSEKRSERTLCSIECYTVSCASDDQLQRQRELGVLQ